MVKAYYIAFLLFCVPTFGQTKLPFHRDNGLIFVDVAVNGNTAHLMLDSGSVNTLLTVKTANVNLKLAAMHHDSYEKGLEGTIVQVPVTLMFGDSKIHSDVMVGNLSNLAATMHVDKCDGIIGQDVLSQFKSVRIDYKNKTIEFEL